MEHVVAGCLRLWQGGLGSTTPDGGRAWAPPPTSEDLRGLVRRGSRGSRIPPRWGADVCLLLLLLPLLLLLRPPRAARGVSARPGGRRGRRHGRVEGRRGEEEDRSQGGWWGSLEAKQIDRWPPRWQDGLKDGPGEAQGQDGPPRHRGPGKCEQFRSSQPQESCLQRGGARPRATIATTIIAIPGSGGRQPARQPPSGPRPPSARGAPPATRQ